jgi:hypothetical protein
MLSHSILLVESIFLESLFSFESILYQSPKDMKDREKICGICGKCDSNVIKKFIKKKIISLINYLYHLRAQARERYS